jgi:glutamine synthetase
MLILEYIWLDANTHIRTKQRSCDDHRIKTILATNHCVLKMTNETKMALIELLPVWNYDGSSTGQATTESSEITLRPVNVMNDPFTQPLSHINKLIVLCESYTIDGEPAAGNTRNKCVSVEKHSGDLEAWFGLEQEFFLFDMATKQPVRWAQTKGIAQGEYYCGLNRSSYQESELMNELFKLSLQVGIRMSGINQEVAPAQWEYQIGPLTAVECADQMYFAKYILYKLCQKYGYYAVFHPKPLTGDWNGSGCHVNMSNIITRDGYKDDPMKHIHNMCKLMKDDHINFFKEFSGSDNHLRLTGKHETSSPHEFTCSVGGRHTSVRIPRETQNNGRGYFEDRRPGSSIQYYKTIAKYLEYMLDTKDI